MKVVRRAIEQTPFGIQETFVLDRGHLEIYQNGDGYVWRFTSPEMFPTSDGKKYLNSGAALEAAKIKLEL